METVTACPLGAQCETARDGALHRCAWYINVRGMHPQTGEEVDAWRCAMAWLPILLVDNTGETRRGKAAIESFRNEMVKQNGELLTATVEGARRALGNGL
jgi:hypothetical protein